MHFLCLLVVQTSIQCQVYIAYTIAYNIKVLINKIKLIIITYRTNACIIIWCNVIWYYCHYTVHSVHFQCIQSVQCTVYTAQWACVYRLHYTYTLLALRWTATLYTYHKTQALKSICYTVLRVVTANPSSMYVTIHCYMHKIW